MRLAQRVKRNAQQAIAADRPDAGETDELGLGDFGAAGKFGVEGFEPGWRDSDDIASLILAKPPLCRAVMLARAHLGADPSGERHLGERDGKSAIGEIVHGIDETIAEDGTIRRSYRLNPEDRDNRRFDINFLPGNNADLEPGQFDVFFIQEAPYMGVLEIYTSDGVGNLLNTTLQGILDSVRIEANGPRGGGRGGSDPPPRPEDDDD